MGVSAVCDIGSLGVQTPSLTDLYGPIHSDLEVAARVFDEELASELSFVNRLCNKARSYRGKMLRPAMLLLSARATGELTRAHHTLAAVVEMVHVATLVHDDVLDEADERRCRPTVRSAAGNVAAVLLGDYLISHAFHLCSGLERCHASRRIAATANVVCEGELLQNHHNGNANLSESEYFGIIGRKTGALTAVCCELGAHYAGANESVVAALSAFGMSTGVAFQIMDDVLDVVGDREVVGKTLGRDLTLGKLTLPAIHCLANASGATAADLTTALVGNTRFGRERLREWLDETDSVAYAVSVATRHVEDALNQLHPLPASPAKDSLYNLAEFIIHRRF